MRVLCIIQHKIHIGMYFLLKINIIYDTYVCIDIEISRRPLGKCAVLSFI